SDSSVDDFIAEFIEDVEVKDISLRFYGCKPSMRIREFLMMNTDKKFFMASLDGDCLDEIVLRNIKQPAEIGFHTVTIHSTLDLSLFLALVSRGDTLIDAPVTITTS
ncbi:hypothetical protein PENTCL1PPCAC_6126, partial [Pristionchus entomophagus]